jgi:hypothetical protein
MRAGHFGWRAQVERTGAEKASTQINLGVADRRAPGEFASRSRCRTPGEGLGNFVAAVKVVDQNGTLRG